jgi:hypothetical protein
MTLLNLQLAGLAHFLPNACDGFWRDSTDFSGVWGTAGLMQSCRSSALG